MPRGILYALHSEDTPRILYFLLLEDTRMAVALYRPHSPALAAAYGDVENHARNQGTPLLGTPGSVSIRKNATGVRFYVRQYYDFDGRKRDQYLGPVATPGA